MAALVLPLPTKATAEDEKEHMYEPTPSHEKLKTTKYSGKYHKVFRKMWIYSLIKTNHNQHRRRRQVGKISNWKGSLGHSSF